MKFLFDLIPVLVFFAVYKWGDGHADSAQALVNQYLGNMISGGTVTPEHAPIMLATAAIIAAALLQVSYQLIRHKKVDTMLWITVLVIVAFGGMTIYFNNDNFIKWKPTILYWCFGGALIFSQLFLKKNAIRAAMEAQIKLPDQVWSRLNLSWTLFFLGMGVLNLFVAFVLFKDNNGAWVNFKLLSLGISFVFILGQSVFLAKYLEEPNDQ